MRPLQLRYKQGGSITIMTVIALVVLIAAVGFALDTGLAYMVRARLNAATDSASLAAARAVTLGTDQPTQTAYAQAAARRFFNANYPSGYLGATATMKDAVVTFNQGLVTVDVTASATMPVGFMGVINSGPLAPAVASETIRKDLDMMLVMDTSGSLAPSGSGVQSAGVTFLNQFSATQDRVGMIHFATGAVIDNPINLVTRGFDRTSMTTKINAFNFSGGTASSEGMWNARNQLNGIAAVNRSSLRVIVFFSDGAPNSFGSYFPFTNTANCSTVGTVISSDTTYAAELNGLESISQQYTDLPGNCSPTYVRTYLSGLPAWYNAHNTGVNHDDPAQREFPVVTTSPRVVTNDVSNMTIAWKNVNRASRNLVEAVAAKARTEGTYVFTLGLGADLLSASGPDNELGQDVLKCMANTADSLSRCYNPAQPVGVYCYAATVSALTPCFSKLASAILRISK
jgi:Flp pilus assembly protein TadG